MGLELYFFGLPIIPLTVILLIIHNAFMLSGKYITDRMLSAISIVVYLICVLMMLGFDSLSSNSNIDLTKFALIFRYKPAVVAFVIYLTYSCVAPLSISKLIGAVDIKKRIIAQILLYSFMIAIAVCLHWFIVSIFQMHIHY